MELNGRYINQLSMVIVHDIVDWYTVVIYLPAMKRGSGQSPRYQIYRWFSHKASIYTGISNAYNL